MTFAFDVGRPPFVPSATPDRRGHGWIQRVLAGVRAQLRMEVAFISEFRGGQRIFRYVDAEPWQTAVSVGGADPLEDSYCQRIVDGRLPAVIADAACVPAALELPVTRDLPVGAHLSVPIHRSDGSVYGTVCCFSTRPDHSLRQRDAAVLRLLALLLGDYLEHEGRDEERRAGIYDRTRRVLDGSGLRLVFQPIRHLETGRVQGYEALARFPSHHRVPTETWFKEASEVDLGVELETAAIRTAFDATADVEPPAYISVNASIATILSPAFGEVMSGAPVDRIVAEITEHAAVRDYAELNAVLAPYRAKGLRIAVDDTGAGYSSLTHILQLSPDIIKLDRSLTVGIAEDRARQSMAAALSHFSADIGADVIAEGIETPADLRVLTSFGIPYGQGYHLGRPAALPELRCRSHAYAAGGTA